MKYLLVLFLFALSTFAACGQNAGHDGVAIDDSADCRWYRKSTCCPQRGTLSTVAAWSDFNTNTGTAKKGSELGWRCKAPKSNCADLYGLLDCRTCSPDDSLYYNSTDGTGVYSVCQKFADKLYDACKGEEWFDTTEPDEDDHKCAKVSDFYENSEDFLEALAPGSFYNKDNKECFNAGSSARPTLVLLVASVFGFGARSPALFLVALLSLSLFAAADCGTTAADSTDPIKFDNTCDCGWYKSDGYCTTEGTDNGNYPWNEGGCPKASGYDRFYACTKKPSQGCMDQVHLMLCAQSHSPKQYDYYHDDDDNVIAFQVCEDQADKIFKACQDSYFFDPGTNYCRRVADKYPHAEDFITSLNGVVHDKDTDSECWNSAPLASLAAPLLLVLAWMLF